MRIGDEGVLCWIDGHWLEEMLKSYLCSRIHKYPTCCSIVFEKPWMWVGKERLDADEID